MNPTVRFLIYTLAFFQTIIFAGCSEHTYVYPETVFEYLFYQDNNDDYDTYIPFGFFHINGKAQTFTVKLSLAHPAQDEISSYDLDDQARYYSTKVTGIQQRISWDWGDQPYEVEKLELSTIDDNKWEAEGITITKSQMGEHLFFTIEISEYNPRTIPLKNRHFKIIFKSDEIDGKSYCDEIHIAQNPLLTFRARYKKRTYQSIIDEKEDGSITYSDNDTRNLINRLNQMEGIETVVADDMIYFFDKEDIASNKALKRLITNNSAPMSNDLRVIPHTRASAESAFAYQKPDSYGYAILFDDTYFQTPKFMQT